MPDQDADQVAAFRARSDQSKAEVKDMAAHLCVFFSELLETFEEDEALELTQTLLIESIASNG